MCGIFAEHLGNEGKGNSGELSSVVRGAGAAGKPSYAAGIFGWAAGVAGAQ